MNRTYLKLSLDLDFILIAITASLKDYVLCHQINNNLHIEFEKIEDHEVFFNVDEPARTYSKYYFYVEEGDNTFFVVSNRNREGFLIPEMNKVDFFMIIQGYMDKEELSMIISKLNKLPDIQVAAQIDPLKLKSHENLVI